MNLSVEQMNGAIMQLQQSRPATELSSIGSRPKLSKIQSEAIEIKTTPEAQIDRDQNTQRVEPELQEGD